MIVTNSTYVTSVERLEAASAAWLHDLEAHGAAPNTIGGYALTVRDFIEFFASEEDKPDIPCYADTLLWARSFDRRGLTLQTQQQYLIRLRAFFNWACKHGWYEGNPVQDRLIPATSNLPPTERIRLSDWRLQRLYLFNPPAHSRAATYPRNYAIVVLLLTSDLRNTELLHLTPADLCWSDRQITVRDGRTGGVRHAAFSELAQSAVRLYLASGIRPKDLSDTAPLFGTTSEKGVFGTNNRDCAWSAGSSVWLSAIVERHVRAVAFVSGVRCRELHCAAVQAESESLAEVRIGQARRNASLLKQKIRP